MIETTRMRSDRPGTPGRRQQMPADDEIDLDAGLARLVELLDDGRVDQAVDLGDDARRPAGPRVVGLAPHLRAISASRSPVGATSRWLKPRGAGVAGEQVEELGEVLAEGLAAGEEPEVARRFRRSARCSCPWRGGSSGGCRRAPGARSGTPCSASCSRRGRTPRARRPPRARCAHRMLASSSNRACSSTSTATSLPAWAREVSAFAIGEVGLTR